MDLKQLANDIKKNVGGEKNIESATHCATRLRLILKDESSADDESLKNVSGVMGLVKQGGQYQIIIGTHVKDLYQEFEGVTSEEVVNQPKKLDIIGTIAGSFTPIIPVITAAGMLSALLALLGAFGVATDGPTYTVLNAISNAAFYFLPVLIGFSAARKFNVNPYMGAFLGAILLHPNLMNVEGLSIFTVPVTPTTYSSSVIPIILSVAFMSVVEPLVKKVTPKLFDFFLVPLLTILIVAPVMLVVLGPIGGIIGNYISAIILFIYERYNWLASMLLGGLFPLLVMTGMHYAIMPVAFQQLATMGFNSITTPNMMCANIAQGGAGLAVAYKTKDKELKKLGASTGLTALLGITEPVMYGVNLRLKKPFYAVMIGGAAGGLFSGLMGLKAYAFASPGLAALAIFIGGDGLSNFFVAIGAVIISFVVSFVLTLVIGFEE